MLQKKTGYCKQSFSKIQTLVWEFLKHFCPGMKFFFKTIVITEIKIQHTYKWIYLQVFPLQTLANKFHIIDKCY